MFLSKWLEMELGETSFRDKYVYSAAGAGGKTNNNNPAS